MGHQVNFFAAPADIIQLQRRIGETEPMLILHSRSKTGEPVVVPSLSYSEGGNPWLYYYLVRSGDLGDVALEHVPSQDYWSIDVIQSPVVEFNSCHFDGRILRRGRVYYVDGFYGERDDWVEKPEAFRAWAKTVLRTTRKCLKRRRSDYIGDSASQWLEQGDGRLVT